MTTLDTNVRILQTLFEEQATCTHFENEADLWQLGEKLEAPTLSFRIARIVSSVLYYLPSFCSRWYLQEISAVVIAHRTRYFTETASIANDHPEIKSALHACLRQSILTSALFQKIEGIIAGRLTPHRALRAPLLERDERRDEHCAFLDRVLLRFQEALDEATIHQIKQIQCFLHYLHAALLPEQQSALDHIRRVIHALESGTHSTRATHHILKTLFSMCAFHVQSNTLQRFLELNCLKKHLRVAAGSIHLIKDARGAPLAKWRAHSAQESWAYTVDQLLGGEGVLPTISTQEKAILQQYLPHAHSLETLVHKIPNASAQLLALDTTYVQLFCTLQLLAGRKAGAGRNILLQNSRLHEVDTRKDFQPMPLMHDSTSGDEGIDAPTLAAFGFPQAAKPYSQAVLTLFSWEDLEKKITLFFGSHGLHVSKHALLTRLHQVRTIFLHECAKSAPTLTPQGLYFLIYGKEYLYSKYREQGYSDIEFFSHGVRFHDDYVPPKKRRNKESLFDANVKKLTTRFKKPKVSMEQKKKEAFPGQSVMQTVYDVVPTVRFALRVLAIRTTGFDREGWCAYKAACTAAKKPAESFMLTTFLEGFQKRIVKMVSALYPLYELDITKDGALTVLLPQELRAIDEKIAGFLQYRDDWKNREKKGEKMRPQEYLKGTSGLLFTVPEHEIDVAGYRKKMKEGGPTPFFASEISVESLSGHSRHLADWVYRIRANAVSLDRHNMTLRRDREGRVWLNYEVPL